MANCGCNSNSSSGDNCYGRDHVVRQALMPIVSNDCTGNSGSQNTIPVNFWVQAGSANTCVTVPAVGATFNLAVPDASVFIVGMWVTAPALGKYPIVGLNTASNLLTLRNSCSDGTTAIAGNPSPGTQVCGTIPLWTTGNDPCLDADSFCISVFECIQNISEDNPLCLPNIPVTTEGQCVRIMGLSAACDSGDCPQPDDPNCVTKLDSVRFCRDTIVFDEGLQDADTDGEDCYSPVVISDDGALAKSAGGNLVYINKIKLDDRNSGYGDATEVSSAMNYSVDVGNYNIPECAKGVFIRGFYQFDNDDNGGLKFTSYIHGTGQPTFNSNYLMIDYDGTGDETGGDRKTSTCFATLVLFGGGDKTLYHEWSNAGTEGDNNYMRVYMAIDAYVQ